MCAGGVRHGTHLMNPIQSPLHADKTMWLGLYFTL